MVKTKILLVEDDKSLREIYGVRLYSEGYDIISAGDGEEALALAIKERPPLIISDVMMPKISGFDMLDILRSTTETKDIRVIMMTALSSEDQRARGEALGADRYLVKSQVGIEDVVRTVHEVLGDAPVSGMASSAAPTAAPVAAPMVSPTVAPTTLAVFSDASTPVNLASAVDPDTQAPYPGTLPQPTAPFSTGRPANLGDRVIHPLESNGPTVNFEAMMNAELTQPASTDEPAASPDMPAPVMQTAPVSQPAELYPPVAPPVPSTPEPTAAYSPDQPQQPAVAQAGDTYEYSTLPPQMPVPTLAPQSPPLTTEPEVPAGLSFEETPYAPNPVMPPAPANTPVAPPFDPAADPSLVVPPRPTPGV